MSSREGEGRGGKGGEGRGGAVGGMRSEGTRVGFNLSFLFARASSVFLTSTPFPPPVSYSLCAGRKARSRRRPEILRMATRPEEIAAQPILLGIRLVLKDKRMCLLPKRTPNIL